jgi:hypothetical protein
VVRESEFEGERVEGETKGEGREGGAGSKKGGDCAVGREDRMTKHGEEMVEGEKGVGICSDECSPCDNVGRRDLMEQGVCVG